MDANPNPDAPKEADEPDEPGETPAEEDHERVVEGEGKDQEQVAEEHGQPDAPAGPTTGAPMEGGNEAWNRPPSSSPDEDSPGVPDPAGTPNQEGTSKQE